ncbi:MAG: hypothetical protein RL634_237 [Bacteroidota bacterium]
MPTLVLLPRNRDGKVIEGQAALVREGNGKQLWDWMNQVTPKCMKKGEPWQEYQSNKQSNAQDVD